MIIYSDSNGELVRVLKTQQEIVIYGPPDVYEYELELDPDTNPLIVNHIDTAWNDVLLIDGVLTYQGAEVAVNPPGQAWIERLREEAAETTIANLPAWAKWTADQMEAYVESNVTDLASAIVVLKAMARMHAAERNKLWPNLEGS